MDTSIALHGERYDLVDEFGTTVIRNGSQRGLLLIFLLSEEAAGESVSRASRVCLDEPTLQALQTQLTEDLARLRAADGVSLE